MQKKSLIIINIDRFYLTKRKIKKIFFSRRKQTQLGIKHKLECNLHLVIFVSWIVNLLRFIVCEIFSMSRHL